MLLLPMLIALVACDTTSTNPTPTVAVQQAEPYANSPEGKPKSSLKPIPDPQEATETKPAGQLPDFLGKAPKTSLAKITAQYQGALDHYAEYSKIPCYCGCAIYTHAHMSLANCFISAKQDNGEVTFTEHNLNCDICQGVAQMTLDGLGANTPLKDIRTAIFKKFNYTGIWTDTPPVQ